MPYLEFTSHLRRHVDCLPLEADAATLPDLLAAAFARTPALRGYVLDDLGHIRQHVAVFVDNQLVIDRACWSIPLRPDSRVYVMQALSGG